MSAPTSTNPAEVPRDTVTNPQREARFTEDIQGQHGSYQVETGGAEAPKRHSTLKKKDSVSRKISLERSSKKPEMSYVHNSGGQMENPNSVFYSPIPTHGNPTEVLADRFAAWRKVLKDFITYFREVQTSYENRAKGINKIGQVLNATAHPPEFARSGGILETTNVLREFQKESYVNAENAARVQTRIINDLTALRKDLSDKIKEIRGLSGDFKNSVEREKEATRKEIVKLTDALTAIDSNPQGAAGKNDPYLIKLGLEKQLKRQIDEENYLHKAYHNIESSGRELESIIVGEIQKTFGSYIKVVRREGEEFLDLVQKLDAATIKLPRDYEWSSFIERDPNMVHPSVALRSIQDIEYPGYKHPAATELLAGLMERKSKYLKSYTPGWYVLSPTHLHEFKTSERTNGSAPVMSLYLPESSLGKHSEPGATSHKFILKARQTGALHRDHSWVFRAESYEAMLQWYENIKKLTEVSGEERNAYVAGTIHRRTESATEEPEAEPVSDDLENDEADQVPYSAAESALEPPKPVRPEGGRFPSDINVNRGLAEPEGATTEGDSARSLIAAAGAISGGDYNRPEEGYTGPVGQRPRSDSHSSTWSYDDKHPTHSTLDDDDDFLPVGAEVPPAVERRMSVKHDYSREHEPRDRSYSGTSARRGPPSRKPTASYGYDPVTGQPDTGMGSPSQQLANIDWAHVIAVSENKHATPAAASPTLPRKTPSRKPTSSYGIDPVTGHPEHGHHHHLDDSHHPYPISENQPIRTEVSSSVTDPGSQSTAERPGTIRTESKSTISDLHVPGEYPKPT